VPGECESVSGEPSRQGATVPGERSRQGAGIRRVRACVACVAHVNRGTARFAFCSARGKGPNNMVRGVNNLLKFYKLTRAK
jgi:hypothetical protein